MPVDSVSALGRVITCGLPAGGASVCLTGDHAAPWRIGADGRPTRPAYAQSAYPDESADPACDFRHDGSDGFGHHGCHLGRAARSGGIDEIAGPAYQGPPGSHPEVPGGELATGAFVH